MSTVMQAAWNGLSRQATPPVQDLPCEHRPGALIRANSPARLKRIVIVGGGAGGLELAARLGDTLGKHRQAEVLLIDRSLTHAWKPLLHELAAGTLTSEEDEIDFLQQARRHDFQFHPGRMDGLDRQRKEVRLAALVDEHGQEVLPRRTIPYDALVIAIGSVVNDFGTAGVAEHAVALNTIEDARHFHRLLLAACARAEWKASGPVELAIVGGGATGVELAAELMESVDEMAGYGQRLRQLKRPVHLRLIEAGPRLLAGLPEELSSQVQAGIEALGVEVMLKQRVTEIGPEHVTLASGERLPSAITVWAAGIQGPRTLQHMDGLETNKLGQLVVGPTLQTTRDPAVFAMGDCASCALAPGALPVPPRAQAAQQQARFLARALRLWLSQPGRALPRFVFRDRGSLVSLGRSQVIGNITGADKHSPSTQRSPRGGLLVHGLIARLGYWGLHRRHVATLQGVWHTVLATLGRWLSGRSQPRVKLH